MFDLIKDPIEPTANLTGLTTVKQVPSDCNWQTLLAPSVVS